MTISAEACVPVPYSGLISVSWVCGSLLWNPFVLLPVSSIGGALCMLLFPATLLLSALLVPLGPSSTALLPTEALCWVNELQVKSPTPGKGLGSEAPAPERPCSLRDRCQPSCAFDMLVPRQGPW